MKTTTFQDRIEEQINLKKSEIFYAKGVLNNLEGMRDCCIARGERDYFKYWGIQQEEYRNRIKMLEREIAKMEDPATYGHRIVLPNSINAPRHY